MLSEYSLIVMHEPPPPVVLCDVWQDCATELPVDAVLVDAVENVDQLQELDDWHDMLVLLPIEVENVDQLQELDNWHDKLVLLPVAVLVLLPVETVELEQLKLEVDVELLPVPQPMTDFTPSNTSVCVVVVELDEPPLAVVFTVLCVVELLPPVVEVLCVVAVDVLNDWLRDVDAGTLTVVVEQSCWLVPVVPTVMADWLVVVDVDCDGMRARLVLCVVDVDSTDRVPVLIDVDNHR